jgi:cell wall-associated NlpC family hydrolase
MIRWTAFLLALALSSAAHAEPDLNPSRSDNVQRILAERGLMQQTLGQIEHVGQSMRDRTSDLVGNAMGFLGVPYRRGGNSEATGFDCSGFVRATFEKTVGLILPRRANEQAAATDKIDKKDLQPGDLVFFNTMRRTWAMANSSMRRAPVPRYAWKT